MGVQHGSPDMYREIAGLKKQLVKFAQDSRSVETRAIAVQLMEHLVPKLGGGQKTVEEFVSAIRVIASDSCRASEHARHALESLEIKSMKFFALDDATGLDSLGSTVQRHIHVKTNEE